VISVRKKLLDDGFRQPKAFFGCHPNFSKHFGACRRDVFRNGKLDLMLGEKLTLEDLQISVHPEVYLIPRNKYFNVVDSWGDSIGIERITFPFSSTDFYVDIDYGKEKSALLELWHTPAFIRLGRISQLGYLVPPNTYQYGEKNKVFYYLPTFPHNRYMHSWLTAILADVILARCGFSRKERAPFVLTAGCHDIATPAGGDSVMRIDPQNLSEEENFSYLLKKCGLDKKWKKEFNFNLKEASSWVKGRGAMGKLLTMIDKMAYAALDCYWVGNIRPGRIRSFIKMNPLVMDAWETIQVTPDRSRFYFSDSQKLHKLIILRALEFQELLLDPYCRALDHTLYKEIGELYHKNIITRDDLLTLDDSWLDHILQDYSERRKRPLSFLATPDDYLWIKFHDQKKAEEFRKKLGDRFSHSECIHPFSTGLDWDTMNKKGEIVPAREAIPYERIKYLEKISKSFAGWYVYYYK
jgi:hypothetical protein